MSINTKPICAPIEIMSGKISPCPQSPPTTASPVVRSISDCDLPQLSRKVTQGSQESREPSPPIKFSNYDVLLMSSSTSDEETVLCFAPENHIGNERFKVLLNLYRSRYLAAHSRDDNEACTRIARELIDTVCAKCVPNGKFYEQDGQGQWKEMSLGPSVVSLVRGALKNGLKEEQEHAVEPTRSLQITGHLPKPKRVCKRSSIVSHESSEESSVSSATVVVPRRFDVICNASGHSLKLNSDHTGNNRLQVMLDIRMKNYMRASKVEKEAIAQEVVSSIMEDVSSSFLRKDKDSGLYRPLSRGLAIVCIQNAFQNGNKKAKNSKSKQQCGNAEVKKLMARKKKKMLLGKLERRNGTNKKGESKNKQRQVPVASCPVSLAATPTTFKAFQHSQTPAPMVVQSLAV